MKCVFLSVAILILLSGAHALDLQFMDEMIQCGNEMGISPDQIKEMMEKQDEKLGCINACVMKKLGGMVDGKLNIDHMYTIVDQNKDTIPNYDKLKEDIQTCHDEVTSAGDLPECQLAGKFTMCVHNHGQG